MNWHTKFVRYALVALCYLFSPIQAQANESLTLVSNPLPTLIGDESSRINQLVTTALLSNDIEVTLVVDRPAFSRSGLLTGKYDGEFAHLSLASTNEKWVYSAPYLPARFFVASKKHSLELVTQFSHLKRNRIATTNQIANTAIVRNIKSVSWARNPVPFDMFEQLAQRRADYVLADQLILDEFNRLLLSVDEKPLHLSVIPLLEAQFHLSLHKDTPNATAIIAAFNAQIAALQKSGEFNKIMGITWTTKDINLDGVADWISSNRLLTPHSLPNNAHSAMPLDTTIIGEASRVYIDGEEFALAQALEIVAQSAYESRDSLLDATEYQRMLKRW